MTELDEYWNKFLTDQNLPPDTKCSGDLFFEAKGFIGDEQTALVISGQKTAFFSSYATFAIDQEPLPVSGELYLVIDRAKKPVCVIRLEQVTIIPFNEVTWEMAKLEGEDQDLASWREKHQEYLEEEGHILGFEYTPDIKLVYQTFMVVYK
ncbi:MAG: ASCH domain-containing protein [Treponema sp.]|nr:ASCH domain-containing protein [Treponema sp.]